jgi:predicted RNase H-like HicB family nuclease
MKTYTISAIPGDDIGNEVIATGIEVPEALAAGDGGFAFTFDHARRLGLPPWRQSRRLYSPGKAACDHHCAASPHGLARRRSQHREDSRLDQIGGLTMRYVALLDGRPGAFGVVVPDLPGCSSGGATVDEAVANAQEAVALWADEMAAQGGEVPKPRSPEAVLADPEVAAAISEGSAIVMVPLIRESGRPARVNISLDRGLLDAIDEAAAARKLTRSAFLASAAREKIANEG